MADKLYGVTDKILYRIGVRSLYFWIVALAIWPWVHCGVVEFLADVMVVYSSYFLISLVYGLIRAIREARL